LVEIDNRLPVRFGFSILRRGGAPPEAPYVSIISPEIIVIGRTFLGVRDFLFGIGDGQKPRSQGLESLQTGESVGAGVVLFARPIQGSIACNVLQPKIWILGWQDSG
jgi:hypothetical protein